jgi:signal transduction histidine kinase
VSSPRAAVSGTVEDPARRLTPDELRELFLFEDLTDAQLAWVAEHAVVVEVAAGADLVVEGEVAESFYVLLSGSLVMSRLVGGDPVEIVRTDQRGVYTGAVQFYLGDQVDQRYTVTVRATSDSTFLAVAAREFVDVFRSWYPMAVHLLQGLFVGQQNSNAMLGQRERLLALGKLSAGLTHELNNPAAAAGRAAHALRERVAGMRHKLGMVASGTLDRAQLQKLVLAQEEFVEKARSAPALTPLQTSDAEDELTDWLDDHDVPGGWELAPVFVAGGLGAADLDAVAAATPEGTLEGALRWLAYTVETEGLLREIIDSTQRISALVGAAKQYSQLDRAPYQLIDVHEGLDATLVMLGPKLAGIEVVKEYDRLLPRVPAYPAELNQVWTNLVDNAGDAMAGSGTLTLRTGLRGEKVLVEVVDTGPGIPPEVRKRIFEPFFTTKPVGQGTGLGLDVSFRVVVSRHHGDLQVESEPGRTAFRVLLPLDEQAPSASDAAPATEPASAAGPVPAADGGPVPA